MKFTFRMFQFVLKEDGMEIDDDDILQTFNENVSCMSQIPILKVLSSNSLSQHQHFVTSSLNPSENSVRGKNKSLLNF